MHGTWNANIEPLTREDERALAIAKDTGDMEARKRLILSCLPMAIHIAAKMCSSIRYRPYKNQRLDDAVSDAMLGLILAVDHYKGDRGRLTTLAWLSIKHSIMNGWRENSGPIRVPQADSSSTEFTRKRMAAARFTTQIEIAPENLFHDDGVNDPSVRAIEHEIAVEMKVATSRLSYREREVIKLRWGLGGLPTYTLRETASIFKVTRERIRQIEMKAIRKLREARLKSAEDTMGE